MLETLRAAHLTEIQTLRDEMTAHAQQHSDAVQMLDHQCQQAIDAEKSAASDLSALHEQLHEEMDSVKARHAAENAALQQQAAMDLAVQAETHDKALLAKKQDHDKEIADMERLISRLSQQQNNVLNDNLQDRTRMEEALKEVRMSVFYYVNLKHSLTMQAHDTIADNAAEIQRLKVGGLQTCTCSTYNSL